MDKLDVIISLLLFIILAGFIKHVSGVIYRRISGSTQSQIVSVLIDKGYYDIALRKCERFLKKRPGDSTLLWLRATLYFKLDQKDKAKSEFNKLIADEPLWKDDAEKYLDALNSET